MAFDKDEIKQLKQLFQKQREEIVDDILGYAKNNLASKEELNQVKASIEHLPTNHEFSHRMDKISGEYKKFTEETPTLNHQLKDHEDRLEVIETQLQISPAI